MDKTKASWMIVKRLKELKTIAGLDNTVIQEMLNPLHEGDLSSVNYSLAHATLEPNVSSLPHRFFTASEVYYILKGTGVMHIDDETNEVGPGDTIYIPPKAIQYIENTGEGDLEFLCIVCPPWQPEAEELV
ncbi:MAG: cupin domain-containing protein [Candidatus Thorarchaeota archaeon]